MTGVGLHGSGGQAIARYTVRTDTHVTATPGRVEFVGTEKSDGTAAEPRADAQRIFEPIITQDHHSQRQ